MATTVREKRDEAVLDSGKLDEKAPIDPEAGQSQEIGVVKDGLAVYPQPTADPLDPLNWSNFKKHTILAIVMYL